MSDREARQLIWVNREGLTEEGNFKEEVGRSGRKQSQQRAQHVQRLRGGNKHGLFKDQKGGSLLEHSQGQEQ